MKSWTKHLTQTLFKGVLALSLLTGTLATPGAGAKSASLLNPRVAVLKNAQALSRLYKSQPHLKKIGAQTHSVFSTFAHPLQTVMLIWVLAAVETYRQQAKMGPLNNQEFDPKLMLEIADMILNDMEIYSGMVGGSVAGVAMAKPMADLRVFLQNKVSRKLFVELLHSGATSFVTFVGWEASSQLWQESVLLLPENQVHAAENLRFTEIFTLRASANDRQIFQAVLGNAFKILTNSKPGLARDWIYNTWRLRLATGEFLTLVTGMVGGSMFAGAIFPPGFIVGTLGGLVGGLATLALPTSWKEAITSEIREARMSYNNRSLTGYSMYLREVGEQFQINRNLKFLPTEEDIAYREEILDWVFQGRKADRSAAFTAAFEEIYAHKVKLQDATLLNSLSKEKLIEMQNSHYDERIKNEKNYRLRIALQSQKARDAAKLSSLIAESKDVIAFSRQRIIESYRAIFLQLDHEISNFQEIAKSPDLFYPSDFQAKISSEIRKIENVKQQLQLIAQGTLPDQIYYFPFSPEDLQQLSVQAGNYLNLSYSRGFDEAWFDE